MGDVLSESEIYVYSKRFLRNCGWKLIGGEPPGGSDGLPRVEAKHPDVEVKGSEGSKKVDIIAYRGGHVLLLELKSTFDRGDIEKLDELVGKRRWRRSLVEACGERNALARAGISDETLTQRMLSGEALVRGIGLGRHHQVPAEYVLLVARSPTNFTATVGTECPIDESYFEG
jgi:hypothetical protein